MQHHHFSRRRWSNWFGAKNWESELQTPIVACCNWLKIRIRKLQRLFFFFVITSSLIYGTISLILSQALESGWKDTALRHVYYSCGTDKPRFVSLILWFVLFTFSGLYAKIPTTANGGCLFSTLQLPQLGDTLSPVWLLCMKISSFSHRGVVVCVCVCFCSPWRWQHPGCGCINPPKYIQRISFPPEF